jgi:glycosyltransferase involved in cell wall biosynthesis
MLISFIVPVYNTEKTLVRCVNSLLAQGLDKDAFEIILINDGSTDRSESLCRELAEKNPCIRFLSQRNTGPSEARNSGIRTSRGDYLCFVDSDDSLIPEGIASLLPYCDGNNDLIRYWCKLVYPGANESIDKDDGNVLFSGSGLDYLRRFGLETFCWNYLYKKQFLFENGLLFKPGIIGEDFLYMYDIMSANPRVVSVARRIYQYNIRPSSISTIRSPEHSRRWVKDLSGSMTRIIQDLERFRESDPGLFRSCRCSLDHKMSALFSRVLSAQYTTKEFLAFLGSCRKVDLLPLKYKANVVVSILNRFPFLYPFASVVYRRLFLPYIYPRINRYGK